MLLVGSLVFFLIEVFYQGEMVNGIRWVMFWFVLAIVLVARIGMEQSPTHAAVYGAGLAAATWLFLIRTHPAYLIGIVLLSIVWWSSHKLVKDCTLIDDETDSTDVGLTNRKLEKSPVAGWRGRANKAGKKRSSQENDTKHAPGRWVLYYSLATLPLFGLGQIAMGSRNISETQAFPLLIVYLIAAAGLLLSTSFLGLRRYLRQRSLKMHGGIAAKWLTSGAKIAALILLIALFIPRPGVGAAWAGLSGTIDRTIQKASALALKFNPAGTGEGREESRPDSRVEANDQAGDRLDKTAKNEEASEVQESQKLPRDTQKSPAQRPQSTPLLRGIISLLIILIACFLIIYYRKQIVALLSAMYQALMAILRGTITSRIRSVPKRNRAPRNSSQPKKAFKSFRNPFGSRGEEDWSNKALVAYTFEALESWAEKQGTPFTANQTPMESVRTLARQHPELGGSALDLGFQFSSLAYGKRLPRNTNIDELRRLWKIIEKPRPPSEMARS